MEMNVMLLNYIQLLYLYIKIVLNGPVISNADAIFLLIFLILLVSVYKFGAGNINVASPLCTPAFSTCSDIA